MRQSVAFFVVIAALAFMAAGISPHGVAGAATPAATDAAPIGKEILGQGASAIAPDRVLLLQRRTFAPGSTQVWVLASTDATSGVASLQCSLTESGKAASFRACSGSPTVEIADNVRIRVQKGAIGNVLPKGTLKSA